MARIYLSSTYGDLVEYREAVYKALRKMRHDVVAMEDYVATDRRPLEKCLADVVDCDIYVGIFAWRCGYVPDDGNPEGKSITELEYRQAQRLGKPTLIFMLAEVADWPDEFRDTKTGEGEAGQRIEALRQELGRDRLVSFFGSAEELATLVAIAVSRQTEEEGERKVGVYFGEGNDFTGAKISRVAGRDIVKGEARPGKGGSTPGVDFGKKGKFNRAEIEDIAGRDFIDKDGEDEQTT
jgi:hypothetical protein